MPLQTFRYAACGGFNTSLDIALYTISYNYIFHKQPLHFPGLFPHLEMRAYIAAFLLSFCVTFPVGFYLSRYVVFQQTETRKTTQLAKYFFVVFICLMLNYGFLKIFIEVFNWYPTPSKLLTTVFVVAFSYISQKHFTFKEVVEE